MNKIGLTKVKIPKYEHQFIENAKRSALQDFKVELKNKIEEMGYNLGDREIMSFY